MTPHISSTIFSSTSGFCFSSISMKKRLMERVSGAAITISSTHCRTLSADSSPSSWSGSQGEREIGSQLICGERHLSRPTWAKISSVAKSSSSSSFSDSCIIFFLTSSRFSMASWSSCLSVESFWVRPRVGTPRLDAASGVRSYAAFLCLLTSHPILKNRSGCMRTVCQLSK